MWPTGRARVALTGPVLYAIGLQAAPILLRSSYTGGNPDRFVGKNPKSYEAKQNNIKFSDTFAFKNSHTTFPGKSVGNTSRVTEA